MSHRHGTVGLVRAAGLACLSAAAALAVAGCGGATSPAPPVSMVGVWALVGYSDHGVEAEEIRGTMSFETDGTFRTEGTVRYPGEPEAPLTSFGTWTHDAVASRLSLTTAEGTGDWDMAWAADTLVLTLADDPGAPPPTVLRLLR